MTPREFVLVGVLIWFLAVIGWILVMWAKWDDFVGALEALW